MNGDAQLMSSDNHCDTALRLFMIGETTVRKQSRRKELRRQRERATLDLEREARSLALARCAFPGKHCIEEVHLAHSQSTPCMQGYIIWTSMSGRGQGVMCTLSEATTPKSSTHREKSIVTWFYLEDTNAKGFYHWN